MVSAESLELVYCFHQKKWYGFSKLIALDGETAVVYLDRVGTILCTHCAIPLVDAALEEDTCPNTSRAD